MQTNKKIISFTKKLIYSLFILWVGGLVPLIHLNVLASSHALPRYQLAVFAKPLDLHDGLPTHLKDKVAQHLKAQRLTQRDLWTPRDISLRLAELVQAGFNTGYLLVSLLASPPPADYGWLKQTASLAGRSAWLAPPEEPPRTLFRIV